MTVFQKKHAYFTKENLKFLGERKDDIFQVLTYGDPDMKERESHFLQTKQNLYVLEVSQHYINPFGSVMQHLDFEMVRLNQYGKFKLLWKT